jgi:hypothetical protein
MQGETSEKESPGAIGLLVHEYLVPELTALLLLILAAVMLRRKR